jgi:peptide alpha-N-acetyltransferase
MGKREEGKALAKQGLALDLKSHVCWHVNALIHRADREYVDALKCYTQGNRIEPVSSLPCQMITTKIILC